MALSAFFFIRDDRVVRKWRKQISDAWIDGDIQMFALTHALVSLKHLPQETLMEMLGKLPNSADLVAEQSLQSEQKSLVVSLSDLIYAADISRNHLRMISASIIAVSVVLSIVFWDWRFISIALIAALVLFLGRRFFRLKFSRLTKRLYTESIDNRSGVRSFLDNIESKNWWPLSAEEKKQVLSNLH